MPYAVLNAERSCVDDARGPTASRFLKPQVAYLEHELGIPRNRLKRVIMALPSLLSYSVDGILRPKVRCISPPSTSP